jgi:hypothetical protein
MKKSRRFGAVVGVVLAATLSVSEAASNLNLSKSNVNRLTYSTGILSAAQAKAMLDDLDAIGPMDEEQTKMWLEASYRRFRINPDVIKKTLILPAGAVCKEAVIILLTNPADEQQALATTVKSSKSNSSE